MQTAAMQKNYMVTILITAAYLLVSWLNFLLFKSGGVLPMPIWPAAGIAIAVCIHYGVRAVPGLWLGTLLANYLVLGSSFSLAVIVGAFNSLAPLMAVAAAQHITGSSNPFEDLRKYFAFIILAVIVHPAITATGGTGGQLWLNLIQADKFSSAWFNWWFAHATGTILFAPVIISLFAGQHEKNDRHSYEYPFIFILTIIVTLLVFARKDPFPSGLPYLLIVPISYISARYSMFHTMLLFASFIITGMAGAVLNPQSELGCASILMPFRMMGVSYSLVLVMLSILRQIHLETESERTAREDQYRRLAENSPAVVYQFRMSPQGEFSFPFINSTAKLVLGTDPEAIKGNADLLLNRIFPEDREEFRNAVLNSAKTLLPYHQIFRHQYENKLMWLEAFSTPQKLEDGSIIWDGLLFDISERKGHEEALKSKTEEIEAFFSSSLDLMCIASTNGRFIRVNKPWERILGYSVADLENRTFLEFVHPDDMPATMDAISRLNHQEEILNFTNRYRCKNGEYRHIEWRSKPRGSLIYATARDITERLAYQQKIKLNEERLDLAMNAANSGLWDWDIEKNQVFFDSRYFTMAGYEPDEFPHDFSEWEKRVHPDDLSDCQKSIGDYMAGKGQSFSIEFRFKKKNGDWMWIRGHGKAAARNSGGKILRMVGTHADITGRRLAEEEVKKVNERLQTVMDSIESCIYIADMETYEILFINQFGKNAWGKDITGEICYKAIQGLDAPCPFCTNKMLLTEDGQPAQPCQWEFKNNYNGRWYQLIDRAINWTDGRIVRMEVATDITQIKQAENLIASKNKELEQLIYVASHDLRSPLVNVDGYSRELEFAVSDMQKATENPGNQETMKVDIDSIASEMKESLAHIRNSTRQMDGLLKGLLKLSRLGRAALNIEPIDMNRLVNEVVSSQGFTAREANVHLKIEELPACAGDRIQVAQVFANLIGNAIKYLDPSRAGTITINGKVENGRSIYCVEDNGIGISPLHQENIFQIFHRLDPHKTEGEGLGLTIVRQSLSMMEGEISVESKPDEGSRFYVSLPHTTVKDN